jgi:cysteine desulfurase / selenocysteine lyase
MFEIKSTYFNTAYFGPTPTRAREYVERSLKRTMDPFNLGFDEWKPAPDRLRKKLSPLIGLPEDNLAIGTSVSEFVSHVANGLGLKSGDDVMLMQDDFPSMVLPWMVLAEQIGFIARLLPVSTFQDPGKFKKEITARTKFAGCSHTMFNTGIQLPIAELGKIAREHGVMFLADTSQSFGATRLSEDVRKNVDILVGVAYKWLCGPYGSAYGYFSNEALAKVKRTHASWQVSVNSHGSGNLLNYTTEPLPAARKFDRGQASSFLITAALEGTLDVLTEVGLENIETHNLKLAAQFLQSLPKGYEVAGGLNPIVCIKPTKIDALELKEKLVRNQVDVSLREGWVRISFHFFNTPEQVERLLALLV